MKLSAMKFAPLIDLMRDVLKDKVKDVKISERLVKSPAVVVTDKAGRTPNM